MSRWAENLRAYAAAEERLLDLISPPVVDPGTPAPEAESLALHHQQHATDDANVEMQLDPAVDNDLLDNTDIQSLISGADANKFRGFDDEWTESTEVFEPYIYGLCRSKHPQHSHGSAASRSLTGDDFVMRTPPKLMRLGTVDVIEIEDSPEAVGHTAAEEHGLASTTQASSFMSNTAAACNYDAALGAILTNGGNAHMEETIDIVERSDDMEMEEAIGSSTEQPPSDCIIYDAVAEHGENVVVLTNEHCCEIIVAAHGVAREQGLAHALLIAGNGANGATLLQLMPEQADAIQQQQQMNGVYIEEVTDDEPNADAHNVYLSDAALEQHLEQDEVAVIEDGNDELEPRLNCYDNESDEDANNENANFVDDTPLEEERADICPVYEHELEDQDDDSEEIPDNEEQSVYQQQIQLLASKHVPLSLEQQLPATISIGSDLESLPPRQHEDDPTGGAGAVATAAQPQTLSARDHSSPTEFPVSSTSMPNGSDYDDYDDELADEQLSPGIPAPRKYPPLLKNTLCAEALDRKLASICQTQPPMSLGEKISSWNLSMHCETVEDVENFDVAFEQHEAELKAEDDSGCKNGRNFDAFYDTLSASLVKITQDFIQTRGLLATEDEAVSTVRIAQRRKTDLSGNQHVVQNYKRLFNLARNNTAVNADKDVDSNAPIVLDEDDDEEEEDGEEQGRHDLKHNSSIVTLVPEEEAEDEDEVEAEQLNVNQQFALKTTQTQTSFRPMQSKLNDELATECKETSTTDLKHGTSPRADLSVPPPQPPTAPFGSTSTHGVASATAQVERHLADVVFNVMREQVQLRQQQQKEEGEEQEQEQTVPPPSAEGAANELFYQQHEFCNYLGLTELATANAVATAMRELASSTVARRSLRVRTQQQLDRMRSSVRSRRREQRRHHAATSSDQSTSIATDREDVQPPPPPPPPRRISDYHEHYNYQFPPPAAMAPRRTDVNHDFYYRAQGDYKEPNGKSSSDGMPSLEEAFAKAYAAAAPAQSQLHECMQNRLKRARETKPSIYIVQALSNSSVSPQAPGRPAPTVGPLPSLEDMEVLRKRPRPSSPVLRLAEPAKEAMELDKSLKRKQPMDPNTISPKRRRTNNAADNNAQKLRMSQTRVYLRNLVTRSTTHLNSKMLRNRRVNLLKSYTLTDAAQVRLRGGSTGSKLTRTPKVVKAVKANLKKATHQHGPREVRTNPERNDLLEGPRPVPEQHRLQQQQQETMRNTVTRLKVAKSPKGGAATATRAQTRQEAKVKAKGPKVPKPARAKSLPMPLQVVTVDEIDASLPFAVNPAVATAPPKRPVDLKRSPDPTEFISSQGVVRPPEQSAATNRFLATARKVAGPPVLSAELDESSPFAHLPMPALIYPHAKPPPPPPPPRAPLSHRRETAGTVGKCLPDITLTPPGGMLRLTTGSAMLQNPLAIKHGKVLYMYYELDQLIVLQEKFVSFWKYSKVFNLLNKQTELTEERRPNIPEPGSAAHGDALQWVHLGRVRRLTNDVEISTPFRNRLCVHNSTPVYIEMRSRALEHHRREATLLTLYVNVYYYCEEELRPKMHSVHLDAVNCDSHCVVYAAITESRYFVMGWQQEQVMGKPRSGLCKYSLTPTLDTLASIREFKQLRHELDYIECLTEDRLIGFGPTRVTIWDHRSGDTIMNYDLGFPLGRNLGAIHLPSFDLDQSSMLVLYQHIRVSGQPSELRVIACELSHATPSHRVLHVHQLPTPQFDNQLVAINTGDHLILKAQTEDEIWISTTDPRLLTYVAPQGTQRFYTHQKSQVIELTAQSLTVDSIANHMLKLALHQRHLVPRQ